MITIVLVDAQIAPNAGNVARLCAGAKMKLHLVGDLGFRLSDKNFKRAGLDYWDFLEWKYFPDKKKYWEFLQDHSFYLFSTKANKNYDKILFQKENFLLFGSETRGLANEWLEQNPAKCYKIPLLEKKVRSYNLATSVAIVSFEALRQLSWQ